MMKKVSLLLLLSLFVFSVNAQSEQWSAGTSSTLLNLKEKKWDDVDGTPYLNNGEFVKGEIIQNGKHIKNQDLRYNAYQDRMEIMVSKDEVYEASKDEDIQFVLQYQLLKQVKYSKDDSVRNGYMFCLSCGDEVSLFKKISKVYLPAEQAQTGYHKDKPARFKDQEQLYLKIPEYDYAIPLESSQKKILSQFEGAEDKLKAYVKSEKLKLRKEEDLIQLIDYYKMIK
ncbi:hypothetical protein [Robertkochia solimangrovi]|uniref:hypothetical protein n=1 Tax=Robertkochia solimangrovi TaxID=2213046 RepID=UPI0011807144|nr:hypothetical protein [Robertkochia solimangrovi]TRZ42024.1 hypothetical protein DMZ48_15430 [Robertkochia solimangrovi]